jgi:hypothetical protein
MVRRANSSKRLLGTVAPTYLVIVLSGLWLGAAGAKALGGGRRPATVGAAV